MTGRSKPGKGDPHVTMVYAVSDHCHYCGDIRVYGDCFGSGGYREILVCCFFDLVRPVAYFWKAQQLLENDEGTDESPSSIGGFFDLHEDRLPSFMAA